MKKLLIFIFYIYIINLLSCNQKTENWTHLRGSNLDGHSLSTNAPVYFNEEKNMVWKTELEGHAWSSPVVLGKQVWVSSATTNGEKMFAICIDYKSGAIIKQIDLFNPVEIQHIHSTNSYATPTPCIEDGTVYFHFGTYGTAAIDTKTYKIIWQRTDLNCDHMQGAASSPILYNNFLILHIEGTDVQYVIALDKNTGKTVWKTERPQEYYVDVEPVYRKAYLVSARKLAFFKKHKTKVPVSVIKDL